MPVPSISEEMLPMATNKTLLRADDNVLEYPGIGEATFWNHGNAYFHASK